MDANRLIELARDCGMFITTEMRWQIEQWERLAAAVTDEIATPAIAVEREACAKVCDERAWGIGGPAMTMENENMEHTQTPWEWSEHKFNAPPFEGTLEHECGIYPVPDGEIGPVAIASGKENARRIVACANACAGVTTEELEQGGFVAGLLERLAEGSRSNDGLERTENKGQA